MLAAEARRAVTFHAKGMPRFAFPCPVDRLDGSDKPIAGLVTGY
jgi:hypothetical protein